MTKLTKRQQEILALIQSHMLQTGSPPTRAEIAKTMGFRSPNAAEDHLRALARKGVIDLVPGTSRGIRLATSMSGIPIIKLERHATHQPIFSETQIIGTCRLERSFFKPAIDYLLHFSLKGIPELSIVEGDYLAIHRTQDLEPGQIMLARSNTEILIRRFSPEFLHQNLVIEGVITGVIRSLIHHSLES